MTVEEKAFNAGRLIAESLGVDNHDLCDKACSNRDGAARVIAAALIDIRTETIKDCLWLLRAEAFSRPGDATEFDRCAGWLEMKMNTTTSKADE